MTQKLSAKEQQKQEHYRDARFSDKYDDIWQTVGKCVFCDLKDKYIFFEEKGVVMTISLFAYIDGHFMIVPRRHVKSTKDLTQQEWDTIRKFSYMAKKLIKEVHGIRGMQLVQKDGASAQSTVSDHIHFHCIPFDAPDLCEWNYRKLKNTPLENVDKYRQARKKIVSYDRKYTSKYKNHLALPIACDALIINTKNQILVQHRKKADQLCPNWLTLPGGHVDDITKSFEEELVREIFEETGHQFNKNGLQLLSSRVGNIEYLKNVQHIKAKYPEAHTFVWNTYAISGVPADISLEPNSDTESLEWLDLDKTETHPELSPEVKHLIKEYRERNP